MSLITVLSPPSHPNCPLFFLRGASSSYVLGVHTSGLLCHLHWGKCLTPDPSLFSRLHASGLAFSPVNPGDRDRAGLDVLRYEYPTANTGDFREPAVDVIHADGTRGLRLIYCGHRIIPGKPLLNGLPSTYVESSAEAETLELDLRDVRDSVKKNSSIPKPSKSKVDDEEDCGGGGGGVMITLRYTVFAGRDVIARSAIISNRSSTRSSSEIPMEQHSFTIVRALSVSIDFACTSPNGHIDMLTLPGAWARERWVERFPLRSGCQWIGSRRGVSSHQSHPFFALLSPSSDEAQGEVRGFSLIYSGNHHGGVEMDQLFQSRALLGIHPDGFSWSLKPGQSFQTPEAVLVFSAEGLGAMSSQFHRLYRERLVRGIWRDRDRPILINNWEATYFQFNADSLIDIAKIAGRLGIELFVLDDGWFGRRNDDTSSLGDWVVDPKKLPHGLGDLGRRISEQGGGGGLKFGLWFEPEMISPDSDLYRLHPDWCLHIAGRSRTEGRNQLVLDFSRPEVVDAVFQQVSSILKSAPITYMKWDMNRHLTEVASSSSFPAERQGEISHRFVLGVYAFADRLVSDFPNVLIEGCSGGGGRYDPGMLYYTPQFWCSDNTDAIARLKIQYGTSMVYPPCTMGSHVSAVPNHQVHRITPMKTRAHVALAGQFGFELDLTKLNASDMAEVSEFIIQAKRTRHLLRHGDLHRLLDPHVGNIAAWMSVSPDRSEAIVTVVLVLAEPNWRLPALKLRGLDPAAKYRCIHGPEGEWRGDTLQELGLPLDGLTQDFSSLRWHLERIKFF